MSYTYIEGLRNNILHSDRATNFVVKVSHSFFVDDDEAIRKLCSRILESHFEVVTAGSGREALTTLNTISYDLMVTDIKMPEMDGFELIDQAIKRRPSLKVLAISGLLTSDMEQRLREGPAACDILRKPFTATALEQAIQIGRASCRERVCQYV